MAKRLSEMAEIVENNKDCVVLAVRPDTSPLDLLKLGGFEGHERMFRMSKDRDTTCITVFRDGDEPYHMNYGSSTTLVREDRRKVRDLVMDCVNLDFGIVTGGRNVRSSSAFNHLVENTCGPRDLDSLREFELIKTPAGDGSLFVNGQHIAHIRARDMDRWPSERGLLMVRSPYEQPTGNGCTVVKGEFVRLKAEELGREPADDAVSEPAQADARAFSDAIDGAFESFLSKTGWRGLDAEAAVSEFVRFAKQDMELSLDDLLREAKEKAAERKSERPESTKSRKSPEIER